MVTPEFRALRLSEIQAFISKLSRLLGIMGGQAGYGEPSDSELSRAFDDSEKKLNEVAKALQRIVDNAFDMDIWLDCEGNTRVGGAIPAKLLTDEEISAIKDLGLF